MAPQLSKRNRACSRAKGVGLLGLLLGAVVTILILARQGPLVPPDGDLTKARDFLGAVGIYTIAIAAFLPLSGFSDRQRRRFRWWLAGLTVYFFMAELVPSLFGQDHASRRTRSSASSASCLVLPPSSWLRPTSFLAAAYVRFTISLFRSRVARRHLLTGVRYGMLSLLLAVLGGVLMGTVFAGRYVGGEGNLLISHAIGFHGLQAVPLVAWLLEQARVSRVAGWRWINAAGLSWLAMTALTFAKRSPTTLR